MQNKYRINISFLCGYNHVPIAGKCTSDYDLKCKLYQQDDNGD